MYIIVYMPVQDVYHVYHCVYACTGRMTYLVLCICMYMTYNMCISMSMSVQDVYHVYPCVYFCTGRIICLLLCL